MPVRRLYTAIAVMSAAMVLAAAVAAGSTHTTDQMVVWAVETGVTSLSADEMRARLDEQATDLHVRLIMERALALSDVEVDGTRRDWFLAAQRVHAALTDENTVIRHVVVPPGSATAPTAAAAAPAPTTAAPPPAPRPSIPPYHSFYPNHNHTGNSGASYDQWVFMNCHRGMSVAEMAADHILYPWPEDGIKPTNKHRINCHYHSDDPDPALNDPQAQWNFIECHRHMTYNGFLRDKNESHETPAGVQPGSNSHHHRCHAPPLY